MAESPATSDTISAVNGAVSLEPEDRLRAETYRALGHLLAAPPDDTTLALFARAPVSDDRGLLSMAWRMLAMSAGRATAPEVADEYQSLFIGLGRGELVPYASCASTDWTEVPLGGDEHWPVSTHASASAKRSSSGSPSSRL